MTLHIEFANCWPLLIMAAFVIAPFTVIYISSIMRNDVTRVGIAHKNTSFWLESKRTPRTLANISSEKPDSRTAPRIGSQS